MADEGFRFSNVQDKVLMDTFETLGIDPNNQEAFAPNMPWLERAAAWFSTPPDARGDMMPPTTRGSFGPGKEPSMMATFDMFGEQFGDNEEASAWLKDERQVLAKQYQEPMHKNRVVSLLDQSVMGGRQRAQEMRAAEQGNMGQPPVMPTPAPTLVPGSPEDEIAREEERRRRLQGGQ